jgi:hypothetical protein
MALRIEFEWVDAGRSADRVSASTMAELLILLDETPLTSHVDRETHLFRDRITVPLYPFAEWITSWWWPMFHEYGEWNVPRAAEYSRRHDMAFAGGGFVYPCVLFQPIGKLLLVRSRRSTRHHSPIEFLRSVSKTVDATEAQVEFVKVISAVIERLHTDGLGGSDLESDWTAITAMEPEEIQFSEVAGRFGLDPFDMEQADAEAITRLSDLPNAEIKDDLFTLGPPCEVEQLLDTIHDAANNADTEPSGSAWSTVTPGLAHAVRRRKPWTVGYEAARHVRKRIGIDGSPIEFTGNHAVASVDLRDDNARLVGVVGSSSPSCALSPRNVSPASRRFALARAVGEFVMREAGGPSLVTTMKTDRQARSRAFAAELLAPAEGISLRIPEAERQWIEEERINSLAEEFDVSSFVIQRQIRNHKLGNLSR